MNKIIYILLLLALIGLIVLVETYTNIDVLISNNFYNFEHHVWEITYEEHQRLSPFFYDGSKRFVAFVGTLCVLYMISSLWIKRWRWNFVAVLTVLLSTIIIPTTVSKIKKTTNIYCPNQIDIYEAKYPYIKIIERYQNNFTPENKGRCFPGGHVTGALSLMSLYLVFKDKRKKYIALGFAITFGSITGTYQILRGEHFISHNLFSMLIATVLIIIINSTVKMIVDYAKDIQVSKQI